LLNLFKEIIAASFSNKKCFSRSTTLQCHLGSVFKLSDQQVLLDDALVAFVPIGVSGDRLLNKLLSGTSRGSLGYLQ
jgi:hypothetical protein